MKNFQTYFYESKKVYEFRIKIANHDMNDKQFSERLRNVLEAYQVETITPSKRIPVQEHRDFPKLGPCECSYIDIGLGYPTIPEQVRQLVIERAGIKADCVCVYPKDQYEFNEEAEAKGKDHEGALLDVEELKDEPDSQSLVGEVRRGSLIKELEKHTRKYEIAGTEKTSNKSTNDLPMGEKSPVGSSQNKIPSPVKGKK
jgi:hypothetical protein